MSCIYGHKSIKERSCFGNSKIEVDEIYELDDAIYSELNLFAKKIAKALKKTFNSRIGMWVEGLEVPHAHIHLMPIESGRDFIFDYPRLKLSIEELQKIAENIKSNLSFLATI